MEDIKALVATATESDAVANRVMMKVYEQRLLNKIGVM